MLSNKITEGVSSIVRSYFQCYVNQRSGDGMKGKRNPVAKDLRQPKYRKRIVKSQKVYDRNKTKQRDKDERYERDGGE